jgi:hypothetical protein
MPNGHVVNLNIEFEFMLTFNSWIKSHFARGRNYST